MEKALYHAGFVLATAVAVSLLVAGLVLGLVPLEADGSDCGSVFAAGDRFVASSSCSQLRSVLRPFAFSALAGALMFGIAASTLSSSRTPATEERPAQPEG